MCDRNIVFSFGLTLLSLWSSTCIAQSVRFNVASLNIHYTVVKKSVDDWTPRRKAVSKVIDQINADIFAFQEMETFAGGDYSEHNIQLDWILQNAAIYEAAAVGDPAIYPSTQPILYRADTFKPLQQGFFFFADTPDKIYSKQWNGGYPYFCSWVEFEDVSSKKRFYVFNLEKSVEPPLTDVLSLQSIELKGETPWSPKINPFTQRVR